MRRLYNEGKIKTLGRRGKFDVKRDFYTPSVISRRIPPRSRSVKTYYYDQLTGIQVAQFHHYETPSGQIIGSFDPKFLLIDGVEYHLPRRNQPAPSRIGNAEINRILRKSGIRGLFTYLYHCSEQVQKVYKKQVTARLVRWGLKEGRN